MFKRRLHKRNSQVRVSQNRSVVFIRIQFPDNFDHIRRSECLTIKIHLNTTYFVHTRVFLQRVHIARNADRCNSHTISVRLSVRPSRSSVLSRRMNIRS